MKNEVQICEKNVRLRKHWIGWNITLFFRAFYHGQTEVHTIWKAWIFRCAKSNFQSLALTIPHILFFILPVCTTSSTVRVFAENTCLCDLDLLERTQSLEDTSRRLTDFTENLRDLQHSLQRCEDKLASHDALGGASKDPKLLERIKVCNKHGF
jgi:hypothetical protein